MSKQWVQYKNDKNGEKFFVEDENERVWIINEPCFMRLPKSEYRLCPAPEVWVDVTKDCEGNNRCALSIHHMGMVCTSGGESFPDIYRLRKVQLWQTSGLDGKNCAVVAFIVEKKVTE